MLDVATQSVRSTRTTWSSRRGSEGERVADVDVVGVAAASRVAARCCISRVGDRDRVQTGSGQAHLEVDEVVALADDHVGRREDARVGTGPQGRRGIGRAASALARATCVPLEAGRTASPTADQTRALGSGRGRRAGDRRGRIAARTPSAPAAAAEATARTVASAVKVPMPRESLCRRIVMSSPLMLVGPDHELARSRAAATPSCADPHKFAMGSQPLSVDARSRD